MSGLFNALLDISRLDAGVIEVQARVFPANRLLDRIRSAFTAQAEAKGLKLLVVPSRMLLHSDPLLLERIIFNLVSNALRYTARGGVVVGCRWRAGRVCIEVWDSGCGIAAEQQREVFQEFVQLHNPERDRDKGLGLGLAIVERLAQLLACTLSLRSQPGRGSVFGLQVPRAAAGAVVEEQREVGRATLSGRLRGVVAVVDDDEAILTGMHTLLSGWGLTVVTARGSAELITQLAAAPDVLLCDFRLRDGVTGLDVIATVQQHFNQRIVVVLITGDTASDAVRDIKASGYPLLHKPLRPAKLRTLLTKMLPHG
jgi:CheY-like chemotaxis protein/anti-sigma regulatory factor (Ser/Thr protein kinase)